MECLDKYLSSSASNRISLGVPTIDAALGCEIACAGVHEIYATERSRLVGAMGFATAIALKAARLRPIIFIRQDFLDAETGALNASGIADFGLNLSRIIFMRVQDAENVLRAGEQAARCTALGAIVMATWGEAKILNFTTSRRLALAASKSNVPVFILRAAAKPSQSAALTRWNVRSAPSLPLEANAPGYPAFDVTLLRHRGGMAGQSWRVEWDRDQRCFRDQKHAGTAPVSRPVVPVSADGQAASGTPQIAWRRAG